MVHHLEDNAGQVALILERSTFSCWPVFEDSEISVYSPTGLNIRFSSRTAQRSPGQLSTKHSRFDLEFPDGTFLELKVGAPVVIPPGLTPEFPGSHFRYKGEELVFTIERPLKQVWTGKEGRAFRARLPEDVAEVMQVLADGHKAFSEDGVFGGFEELFVSLYLGEEVGASGRDGYTVTEVKRASLSGEKLSRIAPFSRRPSQESAKGSLAKVPVVPEAPKTGPASSKSSAPESLPEEPAPATTPAPRAD